jgi:DNA-binding CsgD family transcriptional regulator
MATTVESARLEAFLERLQTARSIEDLQPAAHELRDLLQVSHVIYHTANLKGEQVGAFTYPREWAHRYVEMDYVSVDPVVAGAYRRFHPINWKSLDWSSPQARNFLKDALAYGLGNQGWSIPIWGPKGEFALFSVNHSVSDAEWEAFTRSRSRELLLVSHLFHQQAMSIIDSAGTAPQLELSRREREALSLLSSGQSRSEVAAALQISENTLRAYIDSARHKLGAMNVTHAVALALARGVIVPTGPLPKY